MKKKISSLFCCVASLAMLISVVMFVSCGEDDTSGSDGGGEGADDEIVVSDDYMPLEDYKYSVESADTAAGVYALAFEEGTPTIPAGTVMQIDMDSIVKLVRVVAVEDAGGNVKLTTEPADLCDVFINGSFTLSTEGMSSAKTRGVSDSKNVFYPSSITFYDENDQKHTIELADGTRGGFERRLYSQSLDFSGLTIAENEHARTYLETCTYDFNLDLIMQYNFEEAKEGWDKYRRGELVMQKSAIRGSIDTDLMIRFDAKYSTAEQLDEICIKPNVHKPITAKFPVGPVVVVVVMNTNLYVEGSYEVEGKFSAYTGFATSTSAELGFSWAQGGSINHYADFPSNFTWHKPTVEGSAHLANKLSVFPRINFSVYGLLGPAFDIKPYLRQTLDLGFYDELGNNPKDFYGATYDMYTGYDAAVALTLVPTMNTETIAKSPSWNVVEKQLYHAPATLEYAGEQYSEVEPGKTYAIVFKVRDSNLLTSSEALPVLPWAVKFISNCGRVSSTFTNVIDSTGLAYVSWRPTTKTTDGADPYVLAVMHNSEGREILAERFETILKKDSCYEDPIPFYEYCPDNNHPHMIDLGLPSGTLWACCNIGAEKPEEAGGYFAWGDTCPAPTSHYLYYGYDWYRREYDDKNHLIDFGFIKYCTDSSEGLNGFVDGKTILESSDDAATVNWGNNWCTPTNEQLLELIEYCAWNKNHISYEYGYKITGPNGHSIFMPTAGYYIERGVNPGSSSHIGRYWSNSLYDEDVSYSNGIDFTTSERPSSIIHMKRQCELPVRAVVRK